MIEKLNKPEPKKIKMPPVVDRNKEYDTMEFELDYPPIKTKDEDHKQNNSESISELDSLQRD
jgi:hypothetical protein